MSSFTKRAEHARQVLSGTELNQTLNAIRADKDKRIQYLEYKLLNDYMPYEQERQLMAEIDMLEEEVI